MYEPLFITDLTLAVLAIAAAVVVARRAGRLARDAGPDGRAVRLLRRSLTVLAVVVALRVAVALALTTGSWYLADDRLTVGLPVALIPLIWALVAARRGPQALATVAGHTAATGALISAYLQLVPPAPDRSSLVLALSLALLGATAGGSYLLTRWRGSTPGRLARAPWMAAGLLAALGVTLGAAYPANAAGTGVEHGTHQHGGGPLTVDMLTGPRTGTPDVRFTLTAARTPIRLSSGARVDGVTFNGQAPGPQLRVRQGQLVEVTLLNRDVADGVTLHWHGVDVPNAEDGVPGLTQDAVLPGGRHVYRFVPDRAGSFWYHTHRQSDRLVAGGLFGALIVDPPTGPAGPADRVLFVHSWPAEDGPVTALGTADTEQRTAVAAGVPVRLRLVNSSEDPQRVLTGGTAFRVTALDGNTVNQPGEVAAGTALRLPAGGRLDVDFTMPDATVTVRVAGNDSRAALAMSPSGTGAPAGPREGELFDPIGYGVATDPGLHAADRFDRAYDVVLDNGFGFFDGGLTFANTMNGKLAPAVPTLLVTAGDRVRIRVVNRGLVDHPMHLHGHRALVLSRNGEPVTGSPWWTDTLNVAPGQVFEFAFVADNPGVWMDHCHNFNHAAAGMVMHLAYTGVSAHRAVTTHQR